MKGVRNYSNFIEEVVATSLDKPMLFMARIVVLMLLIIVILLVIRFIKTTKLEKRFSRYSIKPIKNNNKSLIGNIKKVYNDITIDLGNYIKKYNIFVNASKRYQKYVDIFNIKDNNPIYIISSKIIIAIIYLFIIIILRLRYALITPYEMILPFIIGYYTLDVYYIYKFSIARKKIENGLYDAITIMNNAFKSGRSIHQAIDMVVEQLDGPISNEFKHISDDIKYGLDIEIAFKRFADRIKLQEAIYLTSSLSILNKTGGNIIEVFDSIEETLLNRKKLVVELNSLTGSSKFISYMLTVIPLVFVIIINIINNNYFEPLFDNILGILLLIIMILIYVFYIIIVRKVMKVRM